MYENFKQELSRAGENMNVKGIAFELSNVF